MRTLGTNDKTWLYIFNSQGKFVLKFETVRKDRQFNLSGDGGYGFLFVLWGRGIPVSNKLFIPLWKLFYKNLTPKQ